MISLAIASPSLNPHSSKKRVSTMSWPFSSTVSTNSDTPSGVIEKESTSAIVYSSTTSRDVTIFG